MLKQTKHTNQFCSETLTDCISVPSPKVIVALMCEPFKPRWWAVRFFINRQVIDKRGVTVLVFILCNVWELTNREIGSCPYELHILSLQAFCSGAFCGACMGFIETPHCWVSWRSCFFAHTNTPHTQIHTLMQTCTKAEALPAFVGYSTFLKVC